jgi:uncharacterized protein involved in type VI secretion and phage assembly
MNEPTKQPDDKKRYWGKYRGMVINNVDPKLLGRVLVQVPDVLGVGVSSWAMMCMPFGGVQSGMYAPPSIGACVWVEFEQGDSDYPILAGAYYRNLAEKPALTAATPPGVDVVYVGTKAQNGMLMSDVPGPTGGFLFKTTQGASVMINDTHILIQNGKGASIEMIGATVFINGVMLTIGPA